MPAGFAGLGKSFRREREEFLLGAEMSIGPAMCKSRFSHGRLDANGTLLIVVLPPRRSAVLLRHILLALLRFIVGLSSSPSNRKDQSRWQKTPEDCGRSRYATTK